MGLIGDYYLAIISWLTGQQGGDLLSGIIGTVINAFFAGIFILIIKQIFKRLDRGVRSWKGTKVRTLKYQEMEILSETKAIEVLSLLLKWISYIPIILVVWLFLSIEFTLFPSTRGFASHLFGSLKDALGWAGSGVIGYLPNLVILIVIFVLARYFVKLARRLFREIGEEKIRIGGFDSDWARPTYGIARILVIALAIMIAYPYLPGAESPAFKGISIFLGVLLSLGSTGAIANVISGVALTYTRTFKVGDRVKIADVTGDVVEKATFVTRIKTIKNVVISIPNAMVLGNHIINYTSLAREEGIILHTAVTIGYDVPWRKVHELLLAAASATDMIEQEPQPFVLQTGLDDFYVRYELNVNCRNPEQMTGIYSELHKNIQDRFHEAGVEIASPSLSAIREDMVNIPDDYLPKDFKAPPSRLWPFRSTSKKTDEED